jgi:predicted DNA-binding protein (MmcQ/YjbR family)
MNIEELRLFCLSLNQVTESFPFNASTLVFKVEGKIFAIIPLDESETQITLKCNPEKAIMLRETYDCITPAWHMNKKYWNTVYINPLINIKLLTELILHSYNEVVAKIPWVQKKHEF